MANRSFHPHRGSLEIESVTLWCSITVGASGAVSSSVGKGILSVTKESTAGRYTIALQDNYNKLLCANITLLDSTDSDPASVATWWRVKSEQVSSSSAPNIVIQGNASGSSGAAANARSGAVLMVRLELRNSSVS